VGHAVARTRCGMDMNGDRQPRFGLIGMWFMAAWSPERTTNEPHSVGPWYGDATFQSGNLCLPSPSDLQTCACICRIVVPGDGPAMRCAARKAAGRTAFRAAAPQGSLEPLSTDAALCLNVCYYQQSGYVGLFHQVHIPGA